MSIEVIRFWLLILQDNNKEAEKDEPLKSY